MGSEGMENESEIERSGGWMVSDSEWRVNGE